MGHQLGYDGVHLGHLLLHERHLFWSLFSGFGEFFAELGHQRLVCSRAHGTPHLVFHHLCHSLAKGLEFRSSDGAESPWEETGDDGEVAFALFLVGDRAFLA